MHVNEYVDLTTKYDSRT